MNETVVQDSKPLLERMVAARQLSSLDAKSLAANEDVKEFYLGISEGRRKSFRDVKHYRRRKRWLA